MARPATSLRQHRQLYDVPADTQNHLKDWSKTCRIQKIKQERRKKYLHEDKEERREKGRSDKHTLQMELFCMCFQ